ncbi:hypothetical protein KAR91_33920 [Candidatus Pacearchaeota archaeon]|nr:hypothetical protein [Candidatus Pacearchaeota archaeon]
MPSRSEVQPLTRLVIEKGVRIMWAMVYELPRNYTEIRSREEFVKRHVDALMGAMNAVNK